MQLLTVSLYPEFVQFEGRGCIEKHVISDTPVLFDICHSRGNLQIEIKNEKLLLGWSPEDELVPIHHITATYHRVNDKFYPEIFIPVLGYVKVAQRL